MCGTMMPTKPMRPTADTMAAVPSDEAAMTNEAHATNGTRATRLVSPTLMTSSARATTRSGAHSSRQHQVDEPSWRSRGPEQPYVDRAIDCAEAAAAGTSAARDRRRDGQPQINVAAFERSRARR